MKRKAEYELFYSEFEIDHDLEFNIEQELSDSQEISWEEKQLLEIDISEESLKKIIESEANNIPEYKSIEKLIDNSYKKFKYNPESLIYKKPKKIPAKLIEFQKQKLKYIKEAMKLPINKKLLMPLYCSKSFILDSLIYCAINKWGCEIKNNNNVPIIIISNFKLVLYLCSYLTVCNRDICCPNRVKSLKRWFNFDEHPKKGHDQCTIEAKLDKIDIIEERIQELEIEIQLRNQ